MILDRVSVFCALSGLWQTQACKVIIPPVEPCTGLFTSVEPCIALLSPIPEVDYIRMVDLSQHIEFLQYILHNTVPYALHLIHIFHSIQHLVIFLLRDTDLQRIS